MEDNNAQQKKGMALIILSAVLFGFMPLFAKIAYAHGNNAYTLAFHRFFFGSIVMFLIVHFVQKNSLRIKPREMKSIFYLSLPFAFTPVLLYASYNYISSGLATTLHFCYPIMVILICAVFLKDRPSQKKIICCLLCTLGIVLFYTPGGQISLWGMAIALISGLVYAAYIVLLDKSFLRRVAPLTLAFWMTTFSAAEVGVVTLGMGKMVWSLDAAGWAVSFTLAVMATVIAVVAFQRGTAICGAQKASLLSTFEPLTSVVLGIALLGEVLSGRTLLGIICILFSIILLIIEPTSKTPTRDPKAAAANPN